MYRMTRSAFSRILGKHANKFGVAPKEERTFKGKVYASKAEAMYAAQLALDMDLGEIVEVVEQPRLWLGVRENVYVPDFLVVPRLSDFEGERYAPLPYYVDVKGMETPQFRKIKTLWRIYGRLPLYVVKRERDRFVNAEIIERTKK